MTQRSSRETKRAKLGEEFGAKLLVSKFTPDGAAMVLDFFGVVSRGPRKGEARGVIVWEKVTTGGWSHSKHRVEYPGSYGYAVSLTWEAEVTAPGRGSYSESITHAQYMEQLCRSLHIVKGTFMREKNTPSVPCAHWDKWTALAAVDRAAQAEAIRAQCAAEKASDAYPFIGATEAEIDAEIDRRRALKAAKEAGQ